MEGAARNDGGVLMWLYIPSSFVPASECLEKAPEPHSSYSASSTAPFATWSGKPLQPANLPRLWKRERLIRRLSGLTCLPSTAQRGADAWISSLRDSRAKTYPSQAAALAWMESAPACSSPSSTSTTLAVRAGSFWRTSQASLVPEPPLWTKPKGLSKNAQPPASWGSWPTAGGTRNGSLLQRQTWAPAKGVPDGFALHGGSGMWTTPDVCSGARDMSKIDPAAQRCAATKKTTGLPTEAAYRAAPMWPTPNAHDGRRPGADLKSTQGGNLSRDTVMWMTPSVSNSQGNEYTRDRGQPGMERLTLTGQAQQWPTPRATDGTKGGPNQAGSKGDLMLPSAAAQWPTPTASLVNDGEDPASWNARRQRTMERTGNGNGMGMPLTQAAQQWPNFVEHHFSPQGLMTADGQTSCKPPLGSPRRLNPAFACWLMGWPIWWTNPALTSCAKSAMVSYRSKLQLHLLSLCGGQRGDA